MDPAGPARCDRPGAGRRLVGGAHRIRARAARLVSGRPGGGDGALPRLRWRAARSGSRRRGRGRDGIRQLAQATRPRRGGGCPGRPGPQDHQDGARRHAGSEHVRRWPLQPRLQPGVERVLPGPGPGLAGVLPRPAPGGRAADGIHEPGFVHLRRRGARYAGGVRRTPPDPLFHRGPARGGTAARLRRWPDRVQPHPDGADRRPASGRLHPDSPGRGAPPRRRDSPLHAWVHRHPRRQTAPRPLTLRKTPWPPPHTGRAHAPPARAEPKAASAPPAGTRPPHKTPAP